MKKIKLINKIIFSTDPVSYSKMAELYQPLCNLFGKKLLDNSEYRLTQIFDPENNSYNLFYFSNRSLEKTTYKQITFKEFANFDFSFIRSEMNHGIYKNNKKVKAIKYFGKSKLVVNSPYMIEINSGDYIVFSNDLMMVVPKNKFKLLFKK